MQCNSVTLINSSSFGPEIFIQANKRQQKKREKRYINTHQRFCLNKITEMIQLLKIQKGYLFRAGKSTKSVFNFLH